MSLTKTRHRPNMYKTNFSVTDPRRVTPGRTRCGRKAGSGSRWGGLSEETSGSPGAWPRTPTSRGRSWTYPTGHSQTAGRAFHRKSWLEVRHCFAGLFSGSVIKVYIIKLGEGELRILNPGFSPTSLSLLYQQQLSTRNSAVMWLPRLNFPWMW